MSLTAFAFVAQLAAGTNTSPTVLIFPEIGMDDPVAYAGYETRFFRDADRNTLQIYYDRRLGRLVHLWANRENESLGLSARDDTGAPVTLTWPTGALRVDRTGRWSSASYTVTTDAPAVTLGRFVFGSMRIERDVQYDGAHRAPFTDPPYVLREFAELASALDGAAPAARAAALQLLNASTVTQLRGRLSPQYHGRNGASGTRSIRLVQPALDGLDSLELIITPSARTIVTQAGASSVRLTRAGTEPLAMTITIRTTGRPLTPLSRTEIFTADFLRFADGVSRGADTTRARWIERQIRGVELLSSREKLMAGLPTYATYFGRDMLMSALMMQPIWHEQMAEFVIAAALGKLAPNGQVSHEEAIGGQAIRESAAEYAMLLTSGQPERALTALRTRRTTRENYHMIDDEFQLPIMIARYLADARVSASRKRTFLTDTIDGQGPRLARILAALHVVAEQSAGYADSPTADQLIPFAKRDSVRWSSSSWRDSGAGYANGRYAMDVNAIYVPHALQALQQILSQLGALGWTSEALIRELPAGGPSSTLARYVRDSLALQRAVRTWQGAHRHFTVSLDGPDVRRLVTARVAAMPPVERALWTERLGRGAGAPDSALTFLSVALDANTQPLAVVNTDPATRLFLDGLTGQRASGDESRAARERDVSTFVRDYPVGLFIDRIGPAVANDAYAPPVVWEQFLADPYHGPRVVWGREVNLFLLGVASALRAMPTNSPDARSLRDAANRVREAVTRSGFHSELWSYGFPQGTPSALRYGSGADVQLWSTTDLAVQYVWARLPQ